MRLLLLILLAGCTTSKPMLEICRYDDQALRENFNWYNQPPDYAKGKPVKPQPTGTGYACIYLDFDGETVSSGYWNGGQRFTCTPAALSPEAKAQVVYEVSQQFAPYNVVITDSLAVYSKANSRKRIRVIITPTSDWYRGVTGITYNGSITWGDGTPCFVFSDRLYNGPHYIAEIVSHEAGHAATLTHQSEYNPDCTLKLTYKMGVTMGNSMYVPQGQWIYGTTRSCTTFQDDHKLLMAMFGPSLK